MVQPSDIPEEVFLQEEDEELPAQSSVDQATLYHSRERRAGFVDPSKDLFRTHAYTVQDSPFDDDAAFTEADRDAPITVEAWVRRTATGARGIVVEVGDATTGMAIWIPDGGTDISACAGDAGDDGVTVTAADVLAADTQLAKVVFAVIPGTGQARLWVNGRLHAAGAAVNGALPNGWAAGEDGGIGEVATTCSDRIPVGDQITLTNAAVVAPVSFFRGQRPRQFTASPNPIS